MEGRGLVWFDTRCLGLDWDLGYSCDLGLELLNQILEICQFIEGIQGVVLGHGVQRFLVGVFWDRAPGLRILQVKIVQLLYKEVFFVFNFDVENMCQGLSTRFSRAVGALRWLSQG